MFLIILLCTLSILLLGGGLYGYKTAFYSPRTKQEQKPPKLEGTPYEPFRDELVRLYRQIRDTACEEITIISHDGLKLYGRYYHIQDNAPVDLCFHGYRSSAFADFAGGADLSFQMGHNLLLVDQRAHGNSGGRTISFGIQERMDVLSWVSYIIERFGKDSKILLFGVSMGASTVLMASGLSLPSNVKGILADCPYSRPLDIILHVGRSNPLPQWLIRLFVTFGATVYGGFHLTEASAAEAVRNSRIPILIIHGEDDHFVPPEMSEEVRLSNSAIVKKVTFPQAGHAMSYLTDPKQYQSVVSAFVKQIL